MYRLIRTILGILMLFTAVQVQAQYENRFWCFGDSAALDFSSGTPVPVLNSRMSANEGCATVSDRGGSLLFYTNGEKVWNQAHNIMANGDSLGGSIDAEQAALAIQQPGSKDIYYIFTVDGLLETFSYSIVDMRLQGGLGEVTRKKNLLHKGNGEELSAVRHCNGRDVWIMVHDFNNSNTFTAFLLTPSGVSAPVTSSIGHGKYAPPGYIKFSPDGKLLACYLNTDTHEAISIFDFDNSSGRVVREKAYFPDTSGFFPTYALEFSPDGSKLYVSGVGFLQQFEPQLASSAAIWASLVRMPTQSTFGGYGMQTGPDGKIYCDFYGAYLSVINNPDAKGAACGFVDNALYLGGRKCYFGLPAFVCSDVVEKHVPVNIGFLCGNQGVRLSLKDSIGVDSVRWTLLDSNRQYIATLYGNPAYYKGGINGKCIIQVEQTQNCVYAFGDTVLNLRQLSNDMLGKDTLLCPGEVLVLDVTVADGTYRWSDGSANSKLTVKQAGTYWVKVMRECDTVSDTIRIAYQQPAKYLGRDTTICHGSSLHLRLKAKGIAYIWSDGSTDSFLVINKPGSYHVKVLRGHCWEEDSIRIKEYPSLWTALGREYYICEEEDELVKLDAGKGFVNYLWYPTGDTTQWIIVARQGPYYVVVADYRGCQGSDSTTVKERCPLSIHFPDVFSPNADGLNDEFKPVGENITGFQMQVYNRWGELVFATQDASTGWKGRYKETAAPEGTYLYMATIKGYAKDKTEETVFRKGMVRLVR